MENSKQPAFPVPQKETKPAPGLTKREYFAAIAMQGFLAGRGNAWEMEAFVKKSVEYADALLNELAK